MNSKSPRGRAAAPFFSLSLVACFASGLLLGHMVAQLAALDPGSMPGLLCALVIMLAGAASVVLFLQHLQPRVAGVCSVVAVRAWLLVLAAGALLALPEALPFG